MELPYVIWPLMHPSDSFLDLQVKPQRKSLSDTSFTPVHRKYVQLCKKDVQLVHLASCDDSSFILVGIEGQESTSLRYDLPLELLSFVSGKANGSAKENGHSVSTLPAEAAESSCISSSGGGSSTGRNSLWCSTVINADSAPAGLDLAAIQTIKDANARRLCSNRGPDSPSSQVRPMRMHHMPPAP